MDISIQQVFIRRKAKEHKVKWSRHALSRLAALPYTVQDVEKALQQANLIESYPHKHRYLPDCLILTFISSNKPIHVVVALNQTKDYILIVTVYRPTQKEWKDDWQTRK